MIEWDKGNWYYRYRDILIIQPTIKEMKAAILIEVSK